MREGTSAPGLRIDAVHLRGHDQAVHRRGAVAAAIGTAEQPALPAKGDASQASFRSIVRQAYAPVCEEEREGWPPLQHVLDRLGEIVPARPRRPKCTPPFACHPRPVRQTSPLLLPFVVQQIATAGQPRRRGAATSCPGCISRNSPFSGHRHPLAFEVKRRKLFDEPELLVNTLKTPRAGMTNGMAF